MQNEIIIKTGYMGNPKIVAYIDNNEYVMDVDQVEKMLLKQAMEKGYTLAKSNRQKFTRLLINQ